MTTNKNKAESDVTDLCQKRIHALQANLTPATEIDIAGKPYTLADAIAIYQGCLTTYAALNAKKSQVKEALAARTTANTARRAFDKGLKAWIATKFAADSSAAHDFGFAPKAPSVSVATKAQAIEQSKATRKARHTMGKKQKEGIKGDPQASAAHPAAEVTTNGAPAPASNGAHA